MKQALILFIALIFAGYWANIPSFITLPEIDSPMAGDVIRGSVVINGTTNVVSFDSAEISYSYEDNQDMSENWFLIAQSAEPVTEGVLAVWDTTMIADGNYRLRVMVTLNDGSLVETIVSNLRVRNYTPLETSLPMTSEMENIPAPTTEGIFDNTVKPVPTELSPNPGRVTFKELRRSVILGLSVSFGLAIIFLVYTFLQKHRR